MKVFLQALAELIEELMKREGTRESAFREFMGEGPADISDGSAYPDRDALHDRY